MDEKRKSGMSRREFARRAALASASVAATASAVVPLAAVQTDAASSPAPASANAQASVLAAAHTPATELSAPPATQQPAGAPKLSPESQAEVDSRIQAIFSQYGSRFSDEQKADIRRLCALAQPLLDRLRAYALENGDNPALYLKPLVEREKKPAAAQSVASPHPASSSAMSHSANNPAPSPLPSTSKTPAGSAAPPSPAAPKPTAPGAAKAPPADAAKKP